MPCGIKTDLDKKLDEYFDAITFASLPKRLEAVVPCGTKKTKKRPKKTKK